MVVKSKESFEKTRHIKNNDKSKNTFFEDKEIQDIMKKYYQIKRNLIISHDFILILSSNSSLKIMHVLK